MMMKQSSGRIQRTKGSKLKHALQLFVLVAICTWLLYQVKQLYSRKEALEERSAQVSEIGENKYQVLQAGRKDLKPLLDEIAAEFERHGDEEVELEDEENRVKETEEEGSVVDQDEEMDGGSKEKSEEARGDQFQDFIDEDDKDG